MKRLLILCIFVFISSAACGPAQGPLLLQNATIVQRTPHPTLTPGPTIVDLGLASGVPCQPPCWQGLVPGKTSASEAKQLMDKLSTSGTAESVVDLKGNYIVYLSPRPEDFVLVFSDKRGTVKVIDSSDLTFAYTIAELIERMGEPEYIYFKSSRASGSSCQERQKPGDEMRYAKLLLYPPKGALFIVYSTLSEYDLICPDMLVASFCYFPPMRLEDFMDDQDLANTCIGKKLESNNLIQWHGYGPGY